MLSGQLKLKSSQYHWRSDGVRLDVTATYHGPYPLVLYFLHVLAQIHPLFKHITALPTFICHLIMCLLRSILELNTSGFVLYFKTSSKLRSIMAAASCNLRVSCNIVKCNMQYSASTCQWPIMLRETEIRRSPELCNKL